MNLPPASGLFQRSSLFARLSRHALRFGLLGSLSVGVPEGSFSGCAEETQLEKNAPLQTQNALARQTHRNTQTETSVQRNQSAAERNSHRNETSTRNGQRGGCGGSGGSDDDGGGDPCATSNGGCGDAASFTCTDDNGVA